MFYLVALLFRPFLTEHWKQRPATWLGLVFAALVAASVTALIISYGIATLRGTT